MITTKEKIVSLGRFILMVAISISKKIWGVIFYPIAYLFYNWTMNGVVRKNYTRPEKIFANPLKWFMWLHYDDDQEPQGSLWYQRDYCKCDCKVASAFSRFWCAYKWAGIRNTMYNVNYNYLSEQSTIVDTEIVFGSYKWNTKIRNYNGQRGSQLVFMRRASGKVGFLFSCGYMIFGKIPFTFFAGWNADYNGRSTFGVYFK